MRHYFSMLAAWIQPGFLKRLPVPEGAGGPSVTHSTQLACEREEGDGQSSHCVPRVNDDHPLDQRRHDQPQPPALAALRAQLVDGADALQLPPLQQAKPRRSAAARLSEQRWQLAPMQSPAAATAAGQATQVSGRTAFGAALATGADAKSSCRHCRGKRRRSASAYHGFRGATGRS